MDTISKVNMKNERELVKETLNTYYTNNSKYYEEVLKFHNLLFEQDASSILKIKIKKIIIDEDLLNLYNKIVKNYKLKKDYINVEIFDFDDIKDIDFITKFTRLISNNLLEKLNYRLVEINKNNKKRFKIELLY